MTKPRKPAEPVFSYVQLYKPTGKPHPPINEKNCRHPVFSGDWYSQCTRKMKATRLVQDGSEQIQAGFCTQHDPARIAQRSEEAKAAREQQRKLEDLRFDKEELAVQIADFLRLNGHIASLRPKLKKLVNDYDKVVKALSEHEEK